MVEYRRATFFLLSAKLLCKKKFNNGKEVLSFYGSRFLRVMLPVWIYLVAIVCVLWLIKYPLSVTAVIIYALGGAAFSPSGVLGLGHFWYITIILVAYLLVPLLSLFAEKMKGLKAVYYWGMLLGVSAILTAVFYFLGNASYGINLSLFVCAYYYFYRCGDLTNWAQTGMKQGWLPAAIFLLARIVLEIIGISNWEYYKLYDEIFVPLCKSVMGFWLFCALYSLFSLPSMQKCQKTVEYVSAISFDVYITHQFIELAVYEYVPYCNSGTLWGALLMLVISVVLIALNTLALHYLTIGVKKGVGLFKK